ncbi:3-ketosteroid-9-alpha-hydroxylase reductase subunit domain protein [Mycobacterium xenopi 4042]|uniref:3-ketosteroid-9-alpha-hydroxylase reductase subunit domain protein n=1 Tax=Mycobacterium xenopi 4042 TaxID=1299334 RepID=X7ZW74_MYCXE|nr:3-ketosteroid-9-alpha-hydroxylase reductase subunit domain protein [Mycobacterium xenopi 4042]
MTDTVPDEPLGSHVLELQVAEVIAETDEASSLVFAVPTARTFPRTGCATRPASS